MANTNITSISQTSCQWYIDGLSSIWDSDSYQYAYITINGTSSSPVYAPSPTGSGTTTSYGSFSGLSPNTTYTAYGSVVAANGTTYGAGSASFTTQPPPRPSNWDWYTAKTQGANIPNYNGSPAPCTATEWSNFVQRINDFRSYKGLGAYSFSSASSGADFLLSYITQAINAISEMSPPASPPSTPSVVTAYVFNQLRDSLNSIS